MPHRLLLHLETPLAALVAMFTAVTATTGAETLQTGPIWDVAQLRQWCIIGSLLGAWLSIALIRSPLEPGQSPTRQMAFKFASSVILGLLFTPGLLRWFGMERNTDNVMMISGSVAAVGTTLVSVLWPMVQARLALWLGVKLNQTLPVPPTPPEDSK